MGLKYSEAAYRSYFKDSLAEAWVAALGSLPDPSLEDPASSLGVELSSVVVAYT